MKRLVLVFWLLLVPSAQAGTFDGWLVESKMPLPPALVVREQPCPLGNPADPLGMADACTWKGGFVYVAPDAEDTKLTLYHEVGHQFDWQMLDHRTRQLFRRVSHTSGPWTEKMAERFADAYAICSLSRKRQRYYAWDGTSSRYVESENYGYRAKWKAHRRLCRALSYSGMNKLGSNGSLSRSGHSGTKRKDGL